MGINERTKVLPAFEIVLECSSYHCESCDDISEYHTVGLQLLNSCSSTC